MGKLAVYTDNKSRHNLRFYKWCFSKLSLKVAEKKLSEETFNRIIINVNG